MLVIKIKTDNAAFEGDDLYPELARIFNFISIHFKDGLVRQLPVRLFDINGNHVGDVDWK